MCGLDWDDVHVMVMKTGAKKGGLVVSKRVIEAHIWLLVNLITGS